MQKLDFGLCRIRLFPLKMQNLRPSLCRIWPFPPKMQNLRPGLCRIRLFPLKMQNLRPGLCRIRLFPLKMQNLRLGLCRIRIFPSKMQNLRLGLCRIRLFPPKMQNLLPVFCRIRLFPSKMQNPHRGPYRNRLYINNSAMYLLACSQWTRRIGCPLYENPGRKPLIKIVLQSTKFRLEAFTNGEKEYTLAHPRRAFLCHRMNVLMIQKGQTRSMKEPVVWLLFLIFSYF